jgi:hypothetical protein
MLREPLYCLQSGGLPISNSQWVTLIAADVATATREIGKCVIVLAIICTLASTVFNGPALTIRETITGPFLWFCGHKIAQILEPKAQSILDHFNARDQNQNIPKSEYAEFGDTVRI